VRMVRVPFEMQCVWYGCRLRCSAYGTEVHCPTASTAVGPCSTLQLSVRVTHGVSIASDKHKSGAVDQCIITVCSLRIMPACSKSGTGWAHLCQNTNVSHFFRAHCSRVYNSVSHYITPATGNTCDTERGVFC
jgi:hypothetical protein